MSAARFHPSWVMTTGRHGPLLRHRLAPLLGPHRLRPRRDEAPEVAAFSRRAVVAADVEARPDSGGRGDHVQVAFFARLDDGASIRPGFLHARQCCLHSLLAAHEDGSRKFVCGKVEIHRTRRFFAYPVDFHATLCGEHSIEFVLLVDVERFGTGPLRSRRTVDPRSARLAFGPLFASRSRPALSPPWPLSARLIPGNR